MRLFLLLFTLFLAPVSDAGGDQDDETRRVAVAEEKKPGEMENRTRVDELFPGFTDKPTQEDPLPTVPDDFAELFTYKESALVRFFSFFSLGKCKKNRRKEEDEAQPLITNAVTLEHGTGGCGDVVLFNVNLSEWQKIKQKEAKEGRANKTDESSSNKDNEPVIPSASAAKNTQIQTMRVAVKKIYPVWGKDYQQVHENEVEMLKRVRNFPLAVQLLTSFHIKKTLFIVTEPIYGGNLNHHLGSLALGWGNALAGAPLVERRNCIIHTELTIDEEHLTVKLYRWELKSKKRQQEFSGISEPLARHYFIQLVLFFQHLHTPDAEGKIMVYNGLKLDHVMLMLNGIIKLVDFERARVVDQNSFWPTIDYWQLGRLLLLMLTAVPHEIGVIPSPLETTPFLKGKYSIEEEKWLMCYSRESFSLIMGLMDDSEETRRATFKGIEREPWLAGVDWETMRNQLTNRDNWDKFAYPASADLTTQTRLLKQRQEATTIDDSTGVTSKIPYTEAFYPKPSGGQLIFSSVEQVNFTKKFFSEAQPEKKKKTAVL